MELLPIFMNVRGRPCLVVGGGEVASRKVNLLLQAHAHVVVVAPTLGASLQLLKDEAKIQHIPTLIAEHHVAGYMVVIAATNDDFINAQISKWSQSKGIPVNVVDSPQLCSFIVPSVIDRSPVVVAVSSGGSSPVLARLLRARLETLIPASYGKLASLVQKFRTRVKQRFSTLSERKRFWEAVLQSPIVEMMFSGKEEQAAQALEDEISGQKHYSNQGEVYLVGAGPGDPDLLTFRALRLMQQADVIVYDRLVSLPIMALARRDADRIYVGKEQRNHALPQEKINQLLVRLAKEGKRVLRLKGGDPFIFGRGGEEIETLMQEGVLFQVVPGITAAAGCAAYAGIPLTHRDYAQSVVFATGHLQDGTINLNWKALVQEKQTCVFYMGLTGLKVICHELINHGMAPDMPMALIEQGTTDQQKVYTGTLKTFSVWNEHHVKPPTLIIVGEVVKLREKLAWFHTAGDEQV